MAGPDPLCLSFANAGAEDYPGLLAWAHRVGLLSRARADDLGALARRRPAVAAFTGRTARQFRAALSGVLTAVAARRPARSADLQVLNAVIGGMLGRSRLVSRRRGFGWEQPDDPRALDQMLWPVARSAADVLTSTALDAVRQCAAPGCGRLFLDASRNQSRRWCDMAACGNREKGRRYYARRRSIRARSAGGKS